MAETNRYESPLGSITLAAKDGALLGLWLEGQRCAPCKEREGGVEPSDTEILSRAKRWLCRYFAGERPAIDELPLAPAGSAFAKAVWRILCEIPYGETTTYGEIAKRIARENGLFKMSAQAVGGAVGRNPISIIIPCHRVVGANGNLTGYDGGIEKKRWLLAHEGLELSRFHVPAGKRAQ